MKFISKKILIVEILIIVIIGVFLWVNNIPPEIQPEYIPKSEPEVIVEPTIIEIPDSFIIEYPSKYNYWQTINDCGPFNVAAVVRALSKQKVNSAEFAKNIEGRLPNKYTLPWGMEKQLKENGITIEIPNFKSFSDKEKIEYLQEQLSQGKPIILLGEQTKFEHYITIFGFNKIKDEFYIYDSMLDGAQKGLTIDNNGKFPGNRNLSSKELLDFWREGDIGGLYKWYAIIANKTIN